VLRHAAAKERTWTRDLLAPEAEAGVLDGALLDAVSGVRRNRTAYRRHVHSRRRARHLIEAAHDLAHALADARGEESPRVAHARSELRRLESR
jgi:protease PrsW